MSGHRSGFGTHSIRAVAAVITVSAAIQIGGIVQPADAAPHSSHPSASVGAAPAAERTPAATPRRATPSAESWAFTPAEQARITQAAIAGGAVGTAVGIGLGVFVALPIGVAAGLVGGGIGAAIGSVGGPLSAFGGGLLGIAIGGGVGTLAVGIPLIWGPPVIGAVIGGAQTAINIRNARMHKSPGGKQRGARRAAAPLTPAQSQELIRQVATSVHKGATTSSTLTTVELKRRIVAAMGTAEAQAPASIRAQVRELRSYVAGLPA